MNFVLFYLPGIPFLYLSYVVFLWKLGRDRNMGLCRIHAKLQSMLSEMRSGLIIEESMNKNKHIGEVLKVQKRELSLGPGEHPQEPKIWILQQLRKLQCKHFSLLRCLW